MKSVPLKELKEDLSFWVEKASQGEVIQVTKYNRPYVLIAPSQVAGLIQGRHVGEGGLKSVLKEGSSGRWLEVLMEDRDD